MKKYITLGAALVFMTAWTSVSAQPPGVSTGSTAKEIKIGMAHGGELKPPLNFTRALNNFKEAMQKWAEIPVGLEYRAMLGSPDFMAIPVLFISTEQPFQLSEMEKQNLKGFISRGGFLVVDDAAANTPSSPSGACLRQMIQEISGSRKLEVIPNDHLIYQDPFALGGPPLVDHTKTTVERIGTPVWSTTNKTKAAQKDYLEGIFIEGRLSIVYSSKGYFMRWCQNFSENPCLKFGVNLITYGLEAKK
jgi:hypothetical protein